MSYWSWNFPHSSMRALTPHIFFGVFLSAQISSSISTSVENMYQRLITVFSLNIKVSQARERMTASEPLNIPARQGKVLYKSIFTEVFWRTESVKSPYALIKKTKRNTRTSIQKSLLSSLLECRAISNMRPPHFIQNRKIFTPRLYSELLNFGRHG